MIEAVLFDAYGTVVEIGSPRHPYRKLLTQYGTALAGADIRDVMRKPTTLEVVASMVNAKLTPDQLAELREELYAEAGSIRAFDDVAPVWNALRARGIKIGVCSNLATPYVKPVLMALPFAPDAGVWSCDVGHVKDEPEIYQEAIRRLDVAPQNILMVGDTWQADVAGPRAVGMQAVHLKREGSRKRAPEESIPGLHGVLDLLDSPVVNRAQGR